ncbi:FAS1 domain-containing protein [Haematococcus lacustris]|uniref:FAS1 domain-containing protein n=1 Tax=Haematococcus lacustris TaxID=44745 RepID=A0A6A0A3K7_HAELA|nr:FAS1 domain-containing protein [Haematococcus lacustris]
MSVITNRAGSFRSLIDASGPTNVNLFRSLSIEFTVFIPSNAAFTSLANAVGSSIYDLASSSTVASQSVYAHVVPGRLTADQLQDGMQLSTIAGITLTVRVNPATGAIRLTAPGTPQGAAIITRDIVRGAAVGHMVDGVLLISPLFPKPPPPAQVG